MLQRASIKVTLEPSDVDYNNDEYYYYNIMIILL